MIYKLIYKDKEEGIADLLLKNVINAEGENINGTESVVELGYLELVPATYNDQGEQITPAVVDTHFSYDVMSTDIIDFGAYLIEPKNALHAFYGYPINEEV